MDYTGFMYLKVQNKLSEHKQQDQHRLITDWIIDNGLSKSM